MAVVVTENWSDYAFVRGKNARRTFIITGVVTAAAALEALADQADVYRNAGHTLDGRLVADTPEITKKGPWGAYLARVEYTRPATGQLPTDDDNDPLNRPVRWRWRRNPREESTDLDAYDTPMLNTADDPFSADITSPVPARYLTARRFESRYDLAKADAFEGTVNQNIINLPGAGPALPGRLFLHTYEADDEYELGALYVPVTYTFEYRKGAKADSDGIWDGFKHRIRNEGFNAYYDNAGTPTKGMLVTADGEPLTTPALLRSDGTPYNTTYKVTRDLKAPIARPGGGFTPALIEFTADATFLKYRRGRAVNWNPLVLA